MNTKTARDLRFNLFLTSWQTRWASPSHAQKCLGSWGKSYMMMWNFTSLTFISLSSWVLRWVSVCVCVCVCVCGIFKSLSTNEELMQSHLQPWIVSHFVHCTSFEKPKMYEFVFLGFFFYFKQNKIYKHNKLLPNQGETASQRRYTLHSVRKGVG